MILRPTFLSGAFFLFLLQSLLASELDQEWLNLLHYKKTFSGNWESQADGKNFFLAVNGKNNPTDELHSNIEAMNLPEQDKVEHARCKFPARLRYLEKNNLILKNLQKIKCPELEKYFKLLNPSGASLIFSSYYLDTPASTFGHTFIKIIRKDLGDSQQTDLLNYAINYAATVTTENALIYAIMGVAGGFVGEFSSLPYFYKVREYNDHESRDLWEYKLNLTNEEISKLVEHIWEMRQNHFTYYYLTENCSYHMLALLDAVNTSWRLTERNPHFVLPADTVKTLFNTPNLVSSIDFSPSKRRLTMAHIEGLDVNELSILKNILKTNSLPNNFKNNSSSSRVKILDATIESMDFLYPDDILLKEGPKKEIKHHFLSARSQLEANSTNPEIKTPIDDAPHLGHKSRRIKLSQNWFNKTKSQDFEFRFALHDLLDPLAGQAKFATMEMGKFSLSHYNEKNKIRINEISWINVVSLNPWNEFLKPLSWRAWLGSKTLNDKSCKQCLVHGSELAAGMSYSYSNFLLYSMAGAQLLGGPSDLDKDHFRFGVFPEMHLLYRQNFFSLDLFAIYQRFFFHDIKDLTILGSKLNLHLTKNLGIGGELREIQKKYYSSTFLSYYF